MTEQTNREVALRTQGGTDRRHGLRRGSPGRKAFKTVQHRDATNEVAVLIETSHPLRVTPEAEKAEDHSYTTNWAGSPPAR